MELPTPKRDRLFQQLLMLLAFAIPWAKRALPALIGIVVVFALIRYAKRKSASIPPQPVALIALFSLFMLLVLGTTYTQHPDEAWNEIGIKLSYFIFPFLSMFLPTLNRSDVKSIHQAFVGGCFLFMAITVSQSVVVVFDYTDWYSVTYSRLSWYIHPTYAATYQSMALFILLQSGLTDNFLFGKKKLHYFAILLILGYIVLLSSKAGYLCALAAILFSVYAAYRQGKGWVRIAIPSAILMSLFVFTIWVFPTSSDRLKNAVEDIRTSEAGTNVATADTSAVAHASSTTMRLLTWSSSWTLLAENPFGTGTGEAQYRLNMLYEERGEHYAATRQFNAHNQFLQIGAEIGWPGVAALLLLLIAVWLSGRFEPTAQLFVLLCTLNFLFESFLEVQAGIVFFCFWLLVYGRMERRVSF